MEEHIDSLDRIQVALLWLTCFTSTLGAIPAGIVGSTPISLAVVFATLSLVYTLLKGHGRFRIMCSRSNLFLFAYVFYAGITVVMPYTAGIAGQIDRLLKGLVVLTGLVVVYMVLVTNPSERKVQYALSGLLFGAELNAVYGIYQFVGSFRGLPFVNLPTPVPIADAMLLHRAQGFSREPSELAALLVPSLFVTIGITNGINKLIILSILIICALILSFSSGNIFLVVGLLIYLIVQVLKMLANTRVKLLRAGRLVGALLVMLVVISAFYLLGGSIVRHRLVDIVRGANPYSPGNWGRLTSIQASLLVAAEHPLGIGYNMGPTLMEQLGYGTQIHTFFSAILLETGLPGLFLVITFVLSAAFPLLFAGTTRDKNMIGLAAFVSLLYSFATYNGILPFQMIFWGISAVSATPKCTLGSWAPKDQKLRISSTHQRAQGPALSHCGGDGIRGSV